MIVAASYAYRCKFCQETVILYQYEGLHPSSRMGSHYCIGTKEFLMNNPEADPIDGLEELK